MNNSYSYKIFNGSDDVFKPVPSYPNCKTIDIFDFFPKTLVPTQVFVDLKRTQNFGVDLYLLDKNFASMRSVKPELSAYTGPTLTNPDLHIPKEERLILKICILFLGKMSSINEPLDMSSEKMSSINEPLNMSSTSNTERKNEF